MRRTLGLILGPSLFLAVCILPPAGGLGPEGQRVMAVAAWMSVWWLSEAVPIPATSLLPLALFPLLGVGSAAEVSPAYMDPNIVLFMGGFFLAQAIAKWGLHRRIAMLILSRIGGDPVRLTLGFMLATGFLSMWVSNTATTIMMLPIAGAVLVHLQTHGLRHDSSLPTALMLGIAYSASIGGVATLIGTPPNIVLATQYATLFPDRPPLGFVGWMSIGVPVTVLFLPLIWLYLTRAFSLREESAEAGGTEYLEEERRRLGAMSRGEKMTAAVFVLTALGWLFRRNLDLGAFVIPGWASLLGVEGTVHDSTVAIAASLLLFALPVDLKRREFLLDWETARQIPWGILILFGGGIALAAAMSDSGLSAWIGRGLEICAVLPLPALVAAVCLTLTFLTEITSNTATSTLFMPILAGLAVSIEVDPLLLMVPAAISASCAFMLPVATPPNAIVFGSGHVTIGQMARAGLALNFLGAALVTLLVTIWSQWAI